MENLLNGNFVNAYFGICIVCWIISVIATVAIVVIKPVRIWFMKICYQWGKTYGEELIELASEDISELFEKEKKVEKEEVKDFSDDETL